jgi:hypothetical protein
MWKRHYRFWPWWARWLTLHWWKAKIWEANHPPQLPPSLPDGKYTCYEHFEGYWPLSERGGYVGRVDTRSAEQMFKDWENIKPCPTLNKNDERS